MKTNTKKASSQKTATKATATRSKANTKTTSAKSAAKLLELFEKLSVLPVPKKTAGEICVATVRLINAVQPLMNSAGVFVKVTVEDRT